MTTPMLSEQWPRYVLPIVRKEWMQTMVAVPSPVANLFSMQGSESSVEYSAGMGQFGLVPEFNSSTAEGKAAGIEYDDFKKLYETTFTHKEYAKGVTIERKLWDDDRQGNIRQRAQGLGYAFGATLAVHAASVFNNAFSSSYVGADSVALCSASHPNRPDDASTLIGNAGTSALSYANVVSTIQAGKALNDDRGNPLPSIYRVLVVPTELEAQAWTIVNSLNKPGGADNDANFVAAQGLTVLTDPYLTDANNWFMVDPMQAKLHLLWYWRVRPEMAMAPDSDYTLFARYRGYMRYSFGWDDFRWIYGHNVT